MVFISFSKSISLKMNIIARLEFEFSYDGVRAHYPLCHRTPHVCFSGFYGI